MKKIIHIFEEWDIVEKRVRSYVKATSFINYDLIATCIDWITSEHGGTGYACFDFIEPYLDDELFNGKPLIKYWDENQQKWVYRKANHIEADNFSGYDRAVNWVTARRIKHGVQGYWSCRECDYSTISETDPARFPEEHLAVHEATTGFEQVVPITTSPAPPVPPLPPLPIGTFFVRKHQPDSDQWAVCRISPKHYKKSPRADIPWSEKIISFHQTKEEARQQLIRLVTKR
jgi:hypothetical protein